jgi:hypothetical protein
MVVAFVASIVFLVKADADVDNAAYGYLAIFLWFGITAAIPVLLALGIPAIVMTRRVRRARQQERLGHDAVHRGLKAGEQQASGPRCQHTDPEVPPRYGHLG